MKLIFGLFCLALITAPVYAAGVSGERIERSQEVLRQDELLGKKFEQSKKVFIKEIVLPQGCLISNEEVEKITRNFTGHWHSAGEIQEILDILARSYQKVYHSNNLPSVTYVMKEGKLIINFE